ncbi:murein hydrolase activator EnvC, partial [Erwinia amylovora]|nr:murein hydrolase activator EnvC [Erwinia amylovora]
ESQRSERMLAYFGYLKEARQKSIEALRQTHSDLTLQQTSLVAKQTQQKSLFTQQQSQTQKLEGARLARKKTLTTLESSLEKVQAQ